MKQILFIINPKSGTDRKKKLLQQAEKYLNKKLFTYQIAYTQYASHATELASNAVKSGIDIIAAVGGDGSVNEVAKGILGSAVLLAIIPKGSGNGLARALKIPCNVPQALAIINRQQIKKIDVGYANDHLFLSNAGTGFDAFIAQRFAQYKKRGLLNYAKLVIHSFQKYKPCKYHFTIDGTHYAESAFFIAIANGNQFGYEFKIAPNARLDDALLDICLVKPARWYHLLSIIRQSLQGRYNSKYVKHYCGKEITITADKMEWMQADGDAINISETKKMEAHIRPAALSVIVP